MVIAQAETLLVCLDFDGTLAELNPDPYAVTMHPAAEDAIRRLVAIPGTEVAILSGRHLDGLRQVLPSGLNVTLVGSHGAEPGPTLDDDARAHLDDIERQLRDIAIPPAYVEVKPYQRVLHVAPVADKQAAQDMLDAAASLPARKITLGHNVVEFSAVDITKGTWLAEYKRDFAATLFAGDDDTDETAIAALGPTDLAVKVGDKPSLASRRVADVDAMAELLAELADEREAWNASR